jgi:peptidoglycan/xylan/chitin deacetylase (PgdA/CDA1 family)
MKSLYASNTLCCWSGLGGDVPIETWARAAVSAASLLPGGPDAVAQNGWDGLMDHVLGEAEFGIDRYNLSWSRRLYYRLKPFLPRAATTPLRRRYRRRQETEFPLAWPVEDRFVRFLHRVLSSLDRPITFWPRGAHYAFALTHDVEGPAGLAFVPTLADLDERYGFRSSFNFVAEGYPVPQSLLDDLRQRGFEIGLHGLRHDGSLFASRGNFEAAVPRLNHYLHKWGAVGFRAPYTHRNPEWLQALDIEYDASCFDVDPYEPMPGGTMSIWPFMCGRFVELPYTLVQDHTLLVILGERTPRMWLDKVQFLAEWGGLALVNVHPDYVREPAHLTVYEAFLDQMAAQLADSTTTGWHALPRDVVRWWRQRADGCATTAA